MKIALFLAILATANAFYIPFFGKSKRDDACIKSSNASCIYDDENTALIPAIIPGGRDALYEVGLDPNDVEDYASTSQSETRYEGNLFTDEDGVFYITKSGTFYSIDDYGYYTVTDGALYNGGHNSEGYEYFAKAQSALKADSEFYESFYDFDTTDFKDLFDDSYYGFSSSGGFYYEVGGSVTDAASSGGLSDGAQATAKPGASTTIVGGTGVRPPSSLLAGSTSPATPSSSPSQVTSTSTPASSTPSTSDLIKKNGAIQIFSPVVGVLFGLVAAFV